MPLRAHGFTLVEATVVLVIGGVVMAIALPSFSQLRRQAESRATGHLLTSSLALARLNAVSLNAPVAVCAATAAGTCRSDGIWDEGWLVYRDARRLGRPADPGAIIQQVGPGDVAPGLRVRSSRHRSQARFLPDGRSSGSNLSILICHPDARIQTVRVIVNNAGRVRSERRAGTSPTPECGQ
jgi:type IV fimbrial biogenesis protein FimT